jgi:peptide/nickel transport system permease protein
MTGTEGFPAAIPQPHYSRLRIAIPTALLCALLTVCFVGPIVLPLPEPTGGSILDAGQPPFSPGHLLGTDLNGNDVLSRLLYGGRSSLTIAVSANLIGLLFGGLLGALSGLRGGMVDSILMRVLDGFIAFPSLVLVLAIAQGLDSSSFGTMLALTSFTIPAFARVTRGSTLRIREQPFMLYAKLSRTSSWRVLVLHIGPNVLPQLLTFLLLGIGITIIIEGALSYLGLGVPPPAPSWGNMIHHSQQALSANPSLALVPSACLFVTVLSCNWLSDALRTRWSMR